MEEEESLLFRFNYIISSTLLRIHMCFYSPSSPVLPEFPWITRFLCRNFLYFYAILMRVNFLFVNGVDDDNHHLTPRRLLHLPPTGSGQHPSPSHRHITRTPLIIGWWPYDVNVVGDQRVVGVQQQYATLLLLLLLAPSQSPPEAIRALNLINYRRNGGRLTDSLWLSLIRAMLWRRKKFKIEYLLAVKIIIPRQEQRSTLLRNNF